MLNSRKHYTAHKLRLIKYCSQGQTSPLSYARINISKTKSNHCSSTPIINKRSTDNTHQSRWYVWAMITRMQSPFPVGSTPLVLSTPGHHGTDFGTSPLFDEQRPDIAPQNQTKRHPHSVGVVSWRCLASISRAAGIPVFRSVFIFLLHADWVCWLYSADVHPGATNFSASVRLWRRRHYHSVINSIRYAQRHWCERISIT